MASIWQNVLVLGIVTAAIVYLIRRVWLLKSSKRRSGCPACDECLKWWQEAPLAPRDPPDSDDNPGR